MQQQDACSIDSYDKIAVTEDERGDDAENPDSHCPDNVEIQREQAAWDGQQEDCQGDRIAHNQ